MKAFDFILHLRNRMSEAAQPVVAPILRTVLLARSVQFEKTGDLITRALTLARLSEELRSGPESRSS